MAQIEDACANEGTFVFEVETGKLYGSSKGEKAVATAASFPPPIPWSKRHWFETVCKETFHGQDCTILDFLSNVCPVFLLQTAIRDYYLNTPKEVSIGAEV